MEKKGYFYLVISILAFSTLEIVGKLIANSVNPFQLVFLRFFISSIALLPFAIIEIRQKKISFSRKEILVIASLGILVVVIASSFYQLSLIYTKASIVAVIISSNPIFVAPLAYFILGEKADKSVTISLFLGLIGLCVIASPYFTVNSKDLIGILFVAANAISFAAYNVFSKRLLPKFGGLVLTCTAFMAGTAVLFFVLLTAGYPLLSGLNVSNAPYILYMALIGTAVPYLFLFKGLAILPTNRGSLVFFTKPPIAGVLTYLILGETFTLSHTIGTIFILAGIVFIIAAGGKKSKATTEG